MALDVYVMPLWRFKAGIFNSPIEEVLGIAPVIVSLSDPSPPRPPWYLRLLSWVGIIQFDGPDLSPSPAERYEQARREVDALKDEMSRLTGVSVDWQDVGESVYGQQFHGHDFLRDFAAWCDHMEVFPEFPETPEGTRKNPVWDRPEPVRRRFPTLVKHSLYVGYFLPVPFEGVCEVEPFKMGGWWEASHSVASTQTVLRELDDLLNFVDTLPVREPKPGHLRTDEDGARMVAGQLREICESSLTHGLPVIFYG